MWIFVVSAFAAGPTWERCLEEGTLTPADHVRSMKAVRSGFSDPNGALNTLAEISGRNPRCAALPMAQAALLHSLGRNAEASNLLAAIEDDGLADRALAVSLHHEGKSGEELEAAIQANPDDPLLKMIAAESLSPSQRTAYLLDALEKHPDDVRLARMTVQTLEESGYLQKAAEVGHSALARHTDAELLRLVARIDKRLGVKPPERARRPAEIKILADGTEEIVVYSPAKAQAALENRLEDLGWTRRKKIPGGTRFRSNGRVQPYVDIMDNGEVVVQKSGMVKTTMLRKSNQTQGNGQSGMANQGITAPFISARKLRARRTAVMEQIWYEVTEWKHALIREQFQTELDASLPDRMTALWETGLPMYGKGHLDTQKERRDALVMYWQTRACSPEGDAARAVVERFLQNIIQDSPVAMSPEEQKAASAGCSCGVVLELEME